mmetsp:Transcript_5815/g.11081  ORF Transcript_5815/g.11081 Transcript_5815/m.11081 type:complete len:305 (-) Transcript_5815:14-928(-)
MVVPVHLEHIIRVDGVLPSRNRQLCRAPSHSHNNPSGCDGLLLAFAVSQFDSVSINYLAKLVQIGHLLLAQGYAVLEIQARDEIVDVCGQGLPVVCLVLYIPTKRFGVVSSLFAQDCSPVAQLLGDAPHIDTSASQAPRGAVRGRFDKVQTGDFGSQIGSFFAHSQPTGATADTDEVVVEVTHLHTVRLHRLSSVIFLLLLLGREQVRLGVLNERIVPAKEMGPVDENERRRGVAFPSVKIECRPLRLEPCLELVARLQLDVRHLQLVRVQQFDGGSYLDCPLEPTARAPSGNRNASQAHNSIK